MSGFTVFGRKEVLLSMKFNQYVDICRIIRKWKNMNVVRRQYYEKLLISQPRVSIENLYYYCPKTPFQYFCDRSANGLDLHDQEIAWRQLPNESKKLFIELYRSSTKRIINNKNLIIPICDGIIKFLFPQELFRNEYIITKLQNIEINTNELDSLIEFEWHGMEELNRSVYNLMQVYQIESMLSFVELSEFKVDYVWDFKLLYSFIPLKRKFYQIHKSKYWTYVESILESNPKVENIDDLTRNLSSRYNEHYPKSELIPINDLLYGNFVSAVEEVIWYFQPYLDQTLINQMLLRIWTETDQEEKELFNY